MRRRTFSITLALILCLTLMPMTAFAAESNCKTVSAGGWHTMAIKTDGTLWAWGRNWWGQLGNGKTREDAPSPVKIMDNVAYVSAGNSRTMAIKTDGTLWAWGGNTYGGIGDGTKDNNRSSPVKIMDNAASVSAGYFHAMAIKTDGTLWAWGSNSYGELGDGTYKERPFPVKIMDGVISVAVGDSHTMAIKTDGTLWAWGRNLDGRLGDGTEEDRPSPVKIMDSVTSIAVGYDHSMAIKTDGTLWAWGYNAHGELGDGTRENRPSPMKIMDTVASVSAGAGRTAAIKTDDTLWAWGCSYLGWRNGDDDLLPLKIMDNVSSVSAGMFHIMAIKADGTLWAWGGNEYGQLGDGTKENRLSPVKIMASAASGSAKSDGKPSSWAEVQVTTAINAELVPQALQSSYIQAITRAEFCALAVALYEKVTGKEIVDRNTFDDTKDTNVEKAAAIGVVSGVGNNKFDPGTKLTREQAASMLYRLADAVGKPLLKQAASFADNGELSSWAAESVGQIQAAGIMDGVGDNTFAPKEPYTREQSIITILRLFDTVK